MAKESVLEKAFLTLFGLVSRGEGKSKKEEVEVDVETPVRRKKAKRRKRKVARVKEIAPPHSEEKSDKEVQTEEITPKE